MDIRWKRWLYPIAVIGIGAGIGNWLMANPASSLGADETTPIVDLLADAATVATITPRLANYAPQIQLYSQLQSAQQILINSPAPAEVLKILVSEGDSVTKGDVLVKLDTTNLERQLNQLQARRLDLSARQASEVAQYTNNLAALEVEKRLVDIAQRSVQRLLDIRLQGLSSEAELENAERTLQNQILSLQNRELAISQYTMAQQQYSAQLQELDSQLSQAKEALDDATVVAPFSAKVSNVQIQIGASLQTGENLLTLVDQTQQELVAWVSANALDSTESSRGIQGYLVNNQVTVPVKLTHADPAANAGSLRLFFATQDTVNSLILNRYYRMWIDLPTVPAYAVPEASVYSNRYIYAVNDNQLERVNIQVVGERFENGQLWRLVSGELNSKAVLVTRLQDAVQGLAVNTNSDSETLAAVGQ